VNCGAYPRLLATASLLIPALAGAQDGGLDEIIVSATKRTENISDIPMSVEVVSGETIAEYRIMTLEDLSATIPNFIVAEGLTNNNVSMRGVGSIGDRGFESPVTLFVDNVYNPRTRQYRLPFMDVASVEVLRGPQAVLYGINSTAGAVNITSRSNQPGDPFEASINVGAETQFNGTFANFALGGSLADSLGVRLAYSHTESGDGFYTNSTTGESQNAHEEDTVRLSLVWAATVNMTLSGKFSYAEYNMVDGSFGEIVNGIGPALESTDGVLDWRTSADTYLQDRAETMIGHSAPPGSQSDFTSATVQLDYDLASGTSLSAIASYSDFFYILSTDIDMTAGGVVPNSVFPIGIWSATATDTQTSTLELRLASPDGQTIEYIAGLYYFDQDYTESNGAGTDARLTVGGPGAPGAAFFDTLSGGEVVITEKLLSAYGALTWNITNRFRLTGGLRFTDDQKDGARTGACLIDGSGTPTEIPTGGINCSTIIDTTGEIDLSELMPEVAIEWDAAKAVLLYAKAGQTYKAGGFATASGAAPETFIYQPEKATGFEAGMRSSLLNKHLSLNIAAFRTDYDDLQVNAFTTLTDGTVISTITNAGKASTQGVEIDGRWAVADWLLLGGSIAFLDARYDRFQNAPCSRTAQAAGETVCDLTGAQLPFAQDVSANLSADLEFPLGSALRLFAGVVLSYGDEFFSDTTLEPELRNDSVTRVAARAGIGAANNRWDIAISGLNLRNEKVITGSNVLFDYDIAYLGAPRTITLQGSLRFGGQ
jgi:outer membrane receptor protein involved in Fe transport